MKKKIIIPIIFAALIALVIYAAQTSNLLLKKLNTGSLRKTTTIIFTLALVLLIVSPVSASRAPFDIYGKCNIEGTIKTANFEEAYEDPCVKDNNCPVAITTERPERYVLSINIDTLSCTPGETDNPHTYESQFRLNEENKIELYLMDVKEGDQFQSGDRIRGIVESIDLAHTFTSYELEKPVEGINSDKIGNQKNIVDNPQENKNYISVIVVSAIVTLLVVFYILKRR